MTRAPKDHPPKKAPAASRPLHKRLVAWGVMAALGVTGFILMSDRKDLPARVKDNAYVTKLYHERDEAVSATSSLIGRPEKPPEAPDANADMKQQGYNKDDRAKLEAIITHEGDKKE